MSDDSSEKFASDLALMRHRATVLGLYVTAQRLEPAIRMVGFEIAGKVDTCELYEKTLEARAK